MKKILLVPGDGIGPEVMAHAKNLLNTIARRQELPFSLTEVPWGAELWLEKGIGIPRGELEQLSSKYDAILFGALGDPRIPDMAHGREILLGLRTGLDLFINMRPIQLLHESFNILKHAAAADIDMVIFRENTQDIYGGAGGALQVNTTHEVTIDESIHTYRGIQRIIREAFSYAHKQGRKRVTLVDKANAIRFAGKLWTRLFSEVAKDFPQITADHLYVDVAAMHMVQNPRHFDVIVTSNLFGDILSDLGAALAGGLGLAASANINPGVMALFEPVHGSAPDIAGRGIANPFAMFLSLGLMFDYLGYNREANQIKDAITDALARKQCTADLGGQLNSTEAAQFIIRQFE